MMPPNADVLRQTNIYNGTDYRLLRRRLHLQLDDIMRASAKFPGDYREHVHHSFELIVPEHGAYHCRVDGQELTCRPGEFLLLQPGQTHQDHFQGDECFTVFHFHIREEGSLQWRTRIFSGRSFPAEQIAAVEKPELLRDFMRLLLSERCLAASSGIQEGLFLSIFRLLCEGYPPHVLADSPEGAPDKNNALRYKIYEVFDRGIRQGHLSVAEMCKEFNCSQRTLTRLFRTFFKGRSPRKAFNAYRLDCVLRYMHEHPEETIKSVAAQFNYPNVFYFSRIFRKAMGYPPSEIWLHSGDRRQVSVKALLTDQR